MPRHLPLPKGNEKAWRELLPAADLRQHGRHVYMFRNTQTNQIVYTLYPRVEQRTLRQLPFITKKSVPARIRPDLWEAHCRVGPFPVPKQGLDAIKKLRELRKLHELCWDKTNPEYKELSKKQLLWKIMNQRANASADLARVLQIQQEVAESMRGNAQKRDQEQADFLSKRWAFFEGLAAQVKAGKDAELEKRVQTLKAELQNKAGNALATERIERKISHAEADIRQMRSAGRLMAKREARQAEIDAQYEKDVAAFNREVAALEKKGKTEEVEALKEHKPEKPENDYIRKILPQALKSREANFSIEEIQCEWADLLDAEYAAGQWPEAVTHGTLVKSEGTMRILTGEEYRDQIRQDKARIEEETRSILETIKRDAENARRAAAGLPPLVIKVEEPVEEPKEGLSKYTSWIKNPFKRASA